MLKSLKVLISKPANKKHYLVPSLAFESLIPDIQDAASETEEGGGGGDGGDDEMKGKL